MEIPYLRCIATVIVPLAFFLALSAVCTFFLKWKIFSTEIHFVSQVHTTFYFLFFLYQSVVINILFDAISCAKRGDYWYLSQFQSIICYTSEH